MVLALASFVGTVYLWTWILPSAGAWIWILVVFTWLPCVAEAHWLVNRFVRREGVNHGR